jgi:hypothetical protein
MSKKLLKHWYSLRKYAVKDVESTLKQIVVIIAVIIQLIIFLFGPTITYANWWKLLSPILGAAAAWLIPLMTRWIIDNWILPHYKSTGADVFVPDQGSLQKGDNKTLKLILNTKSINYFEWAANIKEITDDSGNILSLSGIDQINSIHETTYKNSVWGNNIAESLKLNLNRLNKNERSILAVKLPSVGIVGYTQIFPINKENWLNFRFGKMNALDLTVDYVVPLEKKYADDEPFALLILNMVLPKIDPYKAVEHEIFKQRGKVITDALAYHLDFFCKAAFPSKKVIPVMFETVNNKILEFIKPYKTNGTEYTKDNTQIVCFDLENTHAKPIHEWQSFYANSENDW